MNSKKSNFKIHYVKIPSFSFLKFKHKIGIELRNGTPETTTSLLVHFGSRCATIYSHKKIFLWLDDSKQNLKMFIYMLGERRNGRPFHLEKVSLKIS